MEKDDLPEGPFRVLALQRPSSLTFPQNKIGLGFKAKMQGLEWVTLSLSLNVLIYKVGQISHLYPLCCGKD